MTPGIVVVGASWGGLEAVSALLAGLPGELRTPIAVAQHRSPDSTPLLLERLLEPHARRTVCEAADKQRIEPGTVYLAPPAYHLLVEGDHFTLTTDAPVRYARPSIDVLFESAADAFGPTVVAVILTGANDDGAAGLAAVKRRGGVAIVQEPEGAERRAMPDAALAAVRPDAILPLDEIGPFLGRLAAAGAAA